MGWRVSRPGPDGSRARQDKGFMSTQRREYPWQHRNCTDHATQTSQFWLVCVAWFARAIARVGTAPPSVPVRLATKSLPSGHRTTQLAVQAFCRTAPSSPPSGAAGRATLGRTATRRSSLPLTPTPSVLEPLHLSLPHFPAGERRWTERYDGKRDLHLQHAA